MGKSLCDAIAWGMETWTQQSPTRMAHFIKYRLPKPVGSHRKASLSSLMSLMHTKCSVFSTKDDQLTRSKGACILASLVLAGFKQVDEWTNWTCRWVNCLLLAWCLGPTQLVNLVLARPDDCVKPCQEFTNANGNYPNYQKVGNIACMHVQFVPGSSFLHRPPKEREDEAIEKYVLKIKCA